MLTEADFPSVPSTQGAFYAPDGRIVYTAERDYLINGPERRGPMRRLLEGLGLRQRPQMPVHPQRDLNGH